MMRASLHSKRVKNHLQELAIILPKIAPARLLLNRIESRWTDMKPTDQDPKGWILYFRDRGKGEFWYLRCPFYFGQGSF